MCNSGNRDLKVKFFDSLDFLKKVVLSLAHVYSNIHRLFASNRHRYVCVVLCEH
jgi:hypothetical protein